MIVGVPKEIKNHEYRVALVPSGAAQLVAAGHTVLVQQGAGLGARITDAAFEQAGAKMVPLEEVFQRAEMIMKVKEPQAEELPRFKEGQLLYTYLHLAAMPELTRQLVATGITAVAYETVQLPDGRLPLLTPMSEVAGKLAAQVGASTLMKPAGGEGVLMGGIPGVRPAQVVVLGGGVVGYNAAKVAVGMGADVTLVDISLPVMTRMDDLFQGRLKTLMSNPHNLAEVLPTADLVVGAVLVPGAKAPHLLNRAMLRQMRPGSVLVDVAVDQGGCAETTRATTHADPTYVEEGVVHYAVANMPGSVPRTSTYGLTNATMPFALQLANRGLAALNDPVLAKGVNLHQGQVTYEAVAEAANMPYVPFLGAA